MPRPCPYLFVYGSLQRGGPPEARGPLEADGRWLGMGSFPGRLYLADGWPAAVVDMEAGGRVHGEVWELGHPADTLAALDAWEGEGYARVLILIELDEKGFEVECWAWTWQGPVDEKARIVGGRWKPDGRDA